jgi:hypothetical protein
MFLACRALERAASCLPRTGLEISPGRTIDDSSREGDPKARRGGGGKTELTRSLGSKSVIHTVGAERNPEFRPEHGENVQQCGRVPTAARGDENALASTNSALFEQGAFDEADERGRMGATHQASSKLLQNSRVSPARVSSQRCGSLG